MESAEEPPQPKSDLDDAPCALARTLANGVFTRVNATFCAWLGYSSDELVGKRRVQDLLTMGGKIFHQTHWLPLLQMQGSISEVRLEMIHKEGRGVPMVVNAIRRESEGATVHDLAAFVARDRDKFERELIASGKKLEIAVAQANRLKEEERVRALFAEEMMGIVSHDLRNPLSTITMGATVLGRGGLPANQLRILGRMSSAAERANRLITDLLDFTQARIGEGLSVAPTSIDLHVAVAEAVDELALAYPARELRHVKEGAGPCRVDSDRLSQMVGNLVSNAVAYGEPGAAITVTSSVAADGFSVAVHNRGKPIPGELLPSLFQPMVRGDAVASGSRSVGLGLYIVGEIAKAHGGSVVASSTEEGDTLFIAEFPN
jgi:sigma-B regulation protein RsbU (phosphoserine phosphatase)